MLYYTMLYCTKHVRAATCPRPARPSPELEAGAGFGRSRAGAFGSERRCLEGNDPDQVSGHL
eukprot:8697384-Lingulodinium_polyedra.AAC.1